MEIFMALSIHGVIMQKVAIIVCIVFISMSLMTIASGGILFEADAQIQSATPNPNQAQQQATTSPSQTQAQQTQQPIEKPFTNPRYNHVENTGPANSGVSGSSNSNGKQTNNGIVLLSQRYISEQYSDIVVGEVLNNGSGPAESVQITVSFYDSNGTFLDSEFTYTNPTTIEPGNRAPFNVFITSETNKENSEKYEFTLQWRDINGNGKSVRVTGEIAPSNELGNVGSNNNVNRVGGSGGGGTGNNTTVPEPPVKGPNDDGDGGEGDG
jgi:hypothetical protein